MSSNAELWIFVWMEVDSEPGGLLVRQVTEQEWNRAKMDRSARTECITNYDLSGHKTNVLYPAAWSPSMVMTLQPILQFWLGKRKLLSAWRRFDQSRPAGGSVGEGGST